MWLNLIDDDLLSNTEFVYNLSYGKDSMAGLHVTIDILGIPVSRVVHAEVWATDIIPADLPPMVEFKSRADAYIKERWGLTVEHVYATRGGADPSKQRSMNCINEGNTSANSGDSRCSEGRGARTGSNGAYSIREKLTYEKLFYHVPEHKETSKFAGGGYRDSRGSKCPGATDISRRRPCGFPHTIGSWCKKLKRLSYQRVPDLQRELVYQRPQAVRFLKAPGNEGQREISCIYWASPPMNRNALPGT